MLNSQGDVTLLPAGSQEKAVHLLDTALLWPLS